MARKQDGWQVPRVTIAIGHQASVATRQFGLIVGTRPSMPVAIHAMQVSPAVEAKAAAEHGKKVARLTIASSLLSDKSEYKRPEIELIKWGLTQFKRENELT